MEASGIAKNAKTAKDRRKLNDLCKLTFNLDSLAILAILAIPMI
jgi:hypothetical protein